MKPSGCLFHCSILESETLVCSIFTWYKACWWWCGASRAVERSWEGLHRWVTAWCTAAVNSAWLQLLWSTVLLGMLTTNKCCFITSFLVLMPCIVMACLYVCLSVFCLFVFPLHISKPHVQMLPKFLYLWLWWGGTRGKVCHLWLHLVNVSF